MTPSDDLFELIRLLDRSEKQRFSKYVKQYSEKGSALYIQLFEDLGQEKKYNERSFLRQNAGKAYVTHFPSNKLYLYNLILDALRGQKKRGGEKKPEEFQIREMMEDAHILNEKMLFSQSLRRLEKARKEAEKYEFHEVLMDILRSLRTHHNEHQGEGYPENVVELLDQIEYLGEIIHVKSQLLALRDRLFLIDRSGAANGFAESPKIVEIMGHPLLAKIPDVGSTEAKINFHNAWGLYHKMHRDLDKAWNHFHSAYLLWEGAPEFRAERIPQYLKMLNNYLSISVATHRYENFVTGIEGMEKGGSSQKPNEKAESIQNSLYIRLQHFLAMRDWDNAIRIEAEFNAKIELIDDKVKASRRLAFLLSFARLHFVLGDWSKSSEYLDQFYKAHKKGIRADKLSEAKLLGLMVTYQQNRMDDLENELRAMKAFVRKRPEVPQYVHETLKAMGRVVVVLEQARISEWTKLLETLNEIRQDSPERYLDGFHFVHGWVSGWVNRKPMHEVIGVS